MDWIKTSDQMPPEGQWVLVTTGDRQKTVEVKCYMGKRENTGSRCLQGQWYDFVEIYDAWTSGHGDISPTSPDYWRPLPELPRRDDKNAE